MVSKERQEVLNRILEYEKNLDFDHDVENDPPTKPLLPNEIDYLRKKWRNKIARFFVSRAADKGINGLIAANQIIIKVLNFPDLGSPTPICSPIGVIAISAPRLKRAIPITSASAHARNTQSSTEENRTSPKHCKRSAITVTGNTESADSFNFVQRILSINQPFFYQPKRDKFIIAYIL